MESAGGFSISYRASAHGVSLRRAVMGVTILRHAQIVRQDDDGQDSRSSFVLMRFKPARFIVCIVFAPC